MEKSAGKSLIGIESLLKQAGGRIEYRKWPPLEIED
jgi:hypothetical protein